MMEKNTNIPASGHPGYAEMSSHGLRGSVSKRRKTVDTKPTDTAGSSPGVSGGPTITRRSTPNPSSSGGSSNSNRRRGAAATSTAAVKFTEPILQFPVRIKPPPPQPQDAGIIPHAPHLVPALFDEISRHPLVNPTPELRDAMVGREAVGLAPGGSGDTPVQSPRPVLGGSAGSVTGAVTAAFAPSTGPLQVQMQRPGSAFSTGNVTPNASISRTSSKEGTPDAFAPVSTITPASDKSNDSKRALLYYTDDHPQNRRGFRYTHCKAVGSALPALQYTAIEVPPYAARASYFDRSPSVALSRDAMTVSTLRGFSTSRANVFVREGHWYYETRILHGGDSRSAVTPAAAATGPGTISDTAATTENTPDVFLGDGRAAEAAAKTRARHLAAGGHVRLGLARREACLQAPVGFDGYGYGLRDTTGEAVHFSRPRNFGCATNKGSDSSPTVVMSEGFGTGDVIGLHVYLPPIASYMGKLRARDGKSAALSYATVSRDRIPIKYKGQLYFELLEYQPVKAMEDMIFSNKRGPSEGSGGGEEEGGEDAGGAGTGHEEFLEIIPGSFIDVYKNGRYMGRAFTDLKSFMPPSSKHGRNKDLAPPSSGGPGGKSAGGDGTGDEGSAAPPPAASRRNNNSSIEKKIFSPDDGQLGYYPAISVFKGGMAQFNFGPHFDCLPAEIAARMEYSKCSRWGGSEGRKSDQVIRPMCERYDEQIAEDIVYDVIDEVEFSLQG